MEELHNNITNLIRHYLKKKKISVAEVVLILEMIRIDIVSQVYNKE